jgi:hypothetical protein
MPLDKLIYRKLTGRRLEDITPPTLKDARARVEKQLTSQYAIRELGRTQDGQAYLTEEDRETATSPLRFVGSSFDI